MRTNKPMKLPNGFGSVYKLSGRRRRPWVARKTVSFKKNGQPNYKYIGYYETKKEALQALTAVNEEEERETATLQEVHERWWSVESPKFKERTMQYYEVSFRQIETLHNTDIDKIKIRQLEKLLSSLPSHGAADRMKIYLRAIWEFAFYKGFVSADQNERVKRLDADVVEKKKNPHKRFTQEEIEKIWEHESVMLLTLIYSGCRISELLELKPEDIHVEEQFFTIRKSKTESGIREVPIPDRLVKYWKDGKPKCFNKTYPAIIMTDLPQALRLCGLSEDHKLHDTRHTCASLLEEALVDDRVVKAILGHKRQDVTGRYSHIDISVKIEAINKIC